MKLIKVFMLILALHWLAGYADAAERMAVSAEIANVRSEPSTESETLWQVEKYFPLLIVEKKGAWYHFKDFEGDQGWIHSSLVDKTPSIIIKVRRCNLRVGPGTDYDVAFTVDRGIPFKVLQTKGKWLEVQHADGDKGWVFRPLVW